jgi:hypothetical protein
MTEPLTDQQLAAAEAALTAEHTTQLPWIADGHEIYRADPDSIIRIGSDDWVGETCNVDLPDNGNANGELIVAAVNALPVLLAEVTRLRSALAEEESACRERGRWLAEVDAALTAAGQDEGGGYIAYARRITEVAAERDRLRAELEQARAKVRAVTLIRCWTNEDGKDFVFADDLRTALEAPACTCGARPVHQTGCDAD